jgi:hypothetical protein
MKELERGIAIRKEVMREPPPGSQPTRAGSAEGAERQYRYGEGVHLREYPDRFVIHRDRVDPRRDPLGHLLQDSPESIVGLAVGLWAGGRTARCVYDLRRGSRLAWLEALTAGLFGGLLAGLWTSRLVRRLKWLFG